LLELIYLKKHNEVDLTKPNTLSFGDNALIKDYTSASIDAEHLLNRQSYSLFDSKYSLASAVDPNIQYKLVSIGKLTSHGLIPLVHFNKLRMSYDKFRSCFMDEMVLLQLIRSKEFKPKKRTPSPSTTISTRFFSYTS